MAAEGEPETPLERYNRLRCEFSELLEQLAEQQNKASESEKVKKTSEHNLEFVIYILNIVHMIY